MQRPFDNSHTLTVLSNDEDAMYWLLDVKSKSESFFRNMTNAKNIYSKIDKELDYFKYINQ